MRRSPIGAEAESLLFPPTQAYHSDRLQVSPLHNIYFEQVGRTDGTPILFLHGGPGGGITDDYRRFFDPKHYRVILFDQRGSGKSTPHAELEGNTTWDLVSDIEKLREHLGISKWIVFGGSWGSTLALAYATAHPQRVAALILRGIFLCRKRDIDWFYQEGASYIFPDAWDKYLKPIPPESRENLVKAYYQRLTGPDLNSQLEAARAWSVWEASTSKLVQDNKMIDSFAEPQFALAFARIECHYFIHRAFFKTDNYLIEQCDKIRHIPCEIVHGRYDVVCPLDNAWALKKALPDAQLHIIPNAGHSAHEVGITKKLIEITEKYKQLRF